VPTGARACSCRRKEGQLRPSLLRATFGTRHVSRSSPGIGQSPADGPQTDCGTRGRAFVMGAAARFEAHPALIANGAARCVRRHGRKEQPRAYAGGTPVCASAHPRLPTAASHRCRRRARPRGSGRQIETRGSGAKIETRGSGAKIERADQVGRDQDERRRTRRADQSERRIRTPDQNVRIRTCGSERENQNVKI
jgi:hypothetical protein